MRERETWWTPMLTALAVGLLACGGGDAGQTEAGGGQAAAGAEDTAAQEGATSARSQLVEVSLSPKNQSGIEGTARLHHHADSLHVTLRLTGLTGGNAYPAHIHRGTCQKGGAVAVGLSSVTAQDSTGTSQTRIPAGKLSMDGSYYVQAHLPDGTPAACGDIPAAGGSSGSGAG